MKRVILYTILSCCAVTAYGQELPDAPKPKKAAWIVEAVALGGLYAADFTLTARELGEQRCITAGGQHWCGPVHETDPLYGRQPGNLRMATTAASVFALEAWTLKRTERNRHAWIRWAGRAGFAWTVVDEARNLHTFTRYHR